MAGSVYSSEADLNLSASRLIELTDNESAPGVKDQTVVDNCSLEAQDIIDTELQGVYSVPFAAGNVPSPIRRIHAKLWRFLLFEHRDSLSVPKEIQDDEKEAMAKLADYATPNDGGRILVGVARVSSATPPGSTEGVFSSDFDDTNRPVRVFGRARETLG